MIVLHSNKNVSLRKKKHFNFELFLFGIDWNFLDETMKKRTEDCLLSVQLFSTSEYFMK